MSDKIAEIFASADASIKIVQESPFAVDFEIYVGIAGALIAILSVVLLYRTFDLQWRTSERELVTDCERRYNLLRHRPNVYLSKGTSYLDRKEAELIVNRFWSLLYDQTHYWSRGWIRTDQFLHWLQYWTRDFNENRPVVRYVTSSGNPKVITTKEGWKSVEKNAGNYWDPSFVMLVKAIKDGKVADRKLLAEYYCLNRLPTSHWRQRRPRYTNKL